MKKKPIKVKIELTYSQYEMLVNSIQAASQMHQNFLMHDDWDIGTDKKAINATKANSRYYKRTLKMISDKWCKGALK